MKQFILLILLSPVAAAAQQVTEQPKERVPDVVKELESSGATNVSWNCPGTGACAVSWTAKPGKTPKFTDHAAARTALLNELAALETKLDDDTASLTDLRRAMKLVLKLSGLAKK
jgi:hypothetical protein